MVHSLLFSLPTYDLILGMAELAEPFGIGQLFSLSLHRKLWPREGKGLLALDHTGSYR